MSRVWRAIFCGSALVLAAAGTVQVKAVGAQARPAQAGVQTAAAQSSGALDSRAFLNQYCVTCHNERTKTADLLLDKLDVNNVAVNAEKWEKAVLKIRSGAMPPATARRPEKAVLDAFATKLENDLDRASAANLNPGWVVEHRMNQFEYANAIRDLLSLEIDVQSMLPADESDRGFDNIAEALALSPTLLERYMFAARKISRIAVGDPAMGPTVDEFRISRGVQQHDRMSDELPVGTRGGTLVHHYFPLDGDYDVRVVLQRHFSNSNIRAIGTKEEIDVLLDGARVTRFSVGGGCATPEARNLPMCERVGALVRVSEYERSADKDLHVLVPVKAGMHALGVAFVKKSFLTEGQAPIALPARHAASTYDAPEMDIDYMRLEGPLNPTGSGDTASRRRIFSCRPARAAEEQACAKTIASSLARRAYRRPVTDSDVEPLLEFYRSGRTGANFERGIQEMVTRLLLSPQFLFRVETPGNGQRAAYRISDLDLASRLSFFLWSSIPDDELLDVATKGRLKDPKVFDEQVRRMIADPKSSAMIKNFGGQWLFLRNMKAVNPDPRLFPEFDDNMREAFLTETEMFLDSQMRGDRPLEELLTAKYTFLNEELARFYGVRNVYGSHFRRVDISDPNRAGLLGQASILTVTSYANRTSPVKRGQYLLDNMLGAPIPPPPPNVPPFKEAASGDLDALSVRQRMEQHRTNAICANCHARMDPLGFALENFNAIGKYRTLDGNKAIDASGSLPDGTKFAGPAEFRAAMLQHRDEIVRTFTQKLMTYALGRPVLYYDMPSVRQIMRDAAPNNYRWSSLILGIVKSAPFQMRKAPDTTATQ